MIPAEIQALLGANGELSRVLQGFVEREQQIAMARDIAAAIAAGSDLMVEAGTGTGKTLAYLVPILLSGARSIVSTGTRTLQDQLFYKDLPVVGEAMRAKRRVALLKGRGNYLCPERLERHLKVRRRDDSAQLMTELVRVREWQSRTRTGDITELLDPESDARLMPLITSTVDNCLGGECPRVGECPLYAARARAFEADLVIVNHHLLFADMALVDDNITALLPSVDTIVMDEAHQVADIARQFFGSRVGSAQFTDLCRDIRSELFLLGDDDAILAQGVDSLERATGRLFALFQRSAGIHLDSLLESNEVAGSVDDVDAALGELLDSLDVASVRSKSLGSCYQRAARLSDRFAMLAEPAALDDEYAHWLEMRDRSFVIHLTPVSIAEQFGARVQAAKQSWILTSATLTVGDSFDHIRSTLGLWGVESRRYASPFDFRQQVRSWLPVSLPRPGGDEHTRALIETCMPVIKSVAGRTFFLFTSYRALETARLMFEAEDDVPHLVQGQFSRAALLDRFRRTERCVLLATHSFWEGVDVRGSDLQCLIIDKLPFASPEDPLVSAKMRAIELEGGNGFMDYLVPEAAITLRQGFGRLVREESDRGLFILGDSRVAIQAYGKLFLSSLPEMQWVTSQAEAIDYVKGIG